MKHCTLHIRMLGKLDACLITIGSYAFSFTSITAFIFSLHLGSYDIIKIYSIL